MNKRRRLKAAKHEAGHALLALFLDCKFLDIEIGDNVKVDIDFSNMVSGKKAVGAIHGVGEGMGDRQYVVMLMAGLAGTRVNRKKSGNLTFLDILCGAEGDWEEAKPVCTPEHISLYEQKQGRNLDQYLNECLAVAHELIRAFKPAHTALVEALMAKGKLDYAECKALWEAHRG